MRLVKVRVPQGRGRDVIRIAHDVGISEVASHEEQIHTPDRPPATKDVVDVDTSTPKAKVFVEALMAAPFYNPHEVSVSVRVPRVIAGRELPGDLTWPIVVPSIEMLEELWQSSHVTWSFVGRVLIAAAILAYGMLHDQLLLLIAGLIFMPTLPLLEAISFGGRTRQWRLARQGGLAFLFATALMVLAGTGVALASEGPMQFQKWTPLLPSLLISLGIGAAAALGLADDAGKRQLVGLAATATTSLVPTWLGIAVVRGFAVTTTASSTAQTRLLSFVLNVAAIVVAGFVAHHLLGMAGSPLRPYTEGMERNETARDRASHVAGD